MAIAFPTYWIISSQVVTFKPGSVNCLSWGTGEVYLGKNDKKNGHIHLGKAGEYISNVQIRKAENGSFNNSLNKSNTSFQHFKEYSTNGIRFASAKSGPIEININPDKCFYNTDYYVSSVSPTNPWTFPNDFSADYTGMLYLIVTKNLNGVVFSYWKLDIKAILKLLTVIIKVGIALYSYLSINSHCW